MFLYTQSRGCGHERGVFFLAGTKQGRDHPHRRLTQGPPGADRDVVQAGLTPGTDQSRGLPEVHRQAPERTRTDKQGRQS